MVRLVRHHNKAPCISESLFSEWSYGFRADDLEKFFDNRDYKYLGFGFYKDSSAEEWKCRPHQDSVKKFKSRLKEVTSRKMPKKYLLR